MRFSSIAVLALAASANAFSPQSLKARFAVRDVPMRKHGFAPLRMADENPSESAKKKSKKQEQLDAIEESMRTAEARRKALEEELAAAEAERIKLEEEAERAAKLPDPPEPGDLSAVRGAATLLGGGAAAAVGARSALQGRERFIAEQKRKEQIKKAAAEQDAKNKAAAAAREARKGSTVSCI